MSHLMHLKLRGDGRVDWNPLAIDSHPADEEAAAIDSLDSEIVPAPPKRTPRLVAPDHDPPGPSLVAEFLRYLAAGLLAGLVTSVLLGGVVLLLPSASATPDTSDRLGATGSR